MTRNLTPWVKGQSGNPLGRQAHVPEELKGIKGISQVELTKLISKLARLTKSELRKESEDPKTSVLAHGIISIFQQCMMKGDFMRLAFLLDRAVGRVKEVKNMPSDEEETDERSELKNLTFNQLVEFVQEYLPKAS